MTEQRGHLLTEQSNPNSQNLDQLSAIELVELFNQEDLQTIHAIAGAKLELAQSIELIAAALLAGGRLFYVGAGTSGRLGVLDAAECPPTFCTPPELVQAIIAGGQDALVKSSEGLEDNVAAGAEIIKIRGIQEKDVVVGIMAGGTTPYVKGALQEARSLGAGTISISCVPREQIFIEADIDIRLLTGPEIVAGSTRLKAGTATKMALNILSTGVMVKLGKVYGNLMVDVAVTNKKLEDRALRILEDLTGIKRIQAETLLLESGKKVKLALLIFWTGLNRVQGQALLDKHHGNLRSALKTYQSL
jgi:N-acetylmuramic acid 6-phosphate etherase